MNNIQYPVGEPKALFGATLLRTGDVQCEKFSAYIRRSNDTIIPFVFVLREVAFYWFSKTIKNLKIMR